MKLSLVAMLSVIALATGCSSSSSEESLDSDQGAVADSQSIKGAFTVTLDGHNVAFDYAITKIDMQAKTVLWNTKIKSKGGHPNVWPDEDVVGKITRVARCPGCFTAEMPGSNPYPLAIVNVNSFEVTSIKYENVEARLGAASAGASQGGSENGDEVGACTQTCSGGSSCKDNVRRSQCKSGSGLFPVMRCMTTFDFKAGETCP